MLAGPANSSAPSATYNTFVPSNLWAYNDGEAVSASVNSLRLAFGIQRLFEKMLVPVVVVILRF